MMDLLIGHKMTDFLLLCWTSADRQCASVCVQRQTRLMGCARGGWGAFLLNWWWWEEVWRFMTRLIAPLFPPQRLTNRESETQLITAASEPLHLALILKRSVSETHLNLSLWGKSHWRREFAFLSLNPDNSAVWWNCSLFWRVWRARFSWAVPLATSSL